MNPAEATKAEQKTKQVEIVHNGKVKEFHFERDEVVAALLAKAIERFGVVGNPHMQSLYDAEGRELPDAETLHQAGVKAGDELVLRQSQVKGG
jgi:hypothetical protein